MKKLNYSNILPNILTNGSVVFILQQTKERLMKTIAFGEMFKELRIRNNYTLRGFCQALGKDPGNISKLERGLLPPPQDQQQLESYAAMFKLKPGTEEYERFFILAAIQAGRIPSKLLSDKQLLSKLPILFRTITGQRIDPEKLDIFIEQLRNS